MRVLAIRALEAFADLAGNVADRAEDVARRLRRDQLPINHPLGSGWVNMGWIAEEPEVPEVFRKTAPVVIDEAHTWTLPSPELKAVLERMRKRAGGGAGQPASVELGMPVHDLQRAWPTFERGWE